MMHKKLLALVLTGTLTCAIALPAMAAETTPLPISAPVSTEEFASIPDSQLYYGTVQEIVKDADGAIVQLRMDSEPYGAYTMNITDQTVWIDSGLQIASDPATLEVGEGIYVFHSAVSTDSLPPQSAAFAVVRNIPMDAGCAQYHEVEALTQTDGQVTITTDNGGLFIYADKATSLSSYDGREIVSFEDIPVGSYVMAWYDEIAESYPAQTHATHLMVLPAASQPTEDVLTRSELIMMLHEQAGKPVVNYAMNYTDVAPDAVYAEAIRWATSEGLSCGYGNGMFGPNDPVSREQMVTILWRYAGSPMLADYPGLTQFSDADTISQFALPAFSWAHQKGYVSAVENDRLAPHDNASLELATTILNAVSAEKA